MSTVYILEPPTNGKVLMVTSVGDIDVELWSKEAPKACRNFVQLCMEGYYDGTIFHRVVPDFIVQGGDPTGTGEGGESIYGAPFKDETHGRLKFNRRGLVAMANAGPNDNASQFFFTMGAAPELQNKHTIFGKVVGDTIYNMIKLQECEVDSNERPLFPHKIIRTEILSNPFDDIVPRASRKSKGKSDEDKKPKSKSKATKNFKLLSFGEEAEEEEHAIDKASESMRGKSKSSHDLTNDPRLSSVPAVDVDALKPKEEKGEKRALSDSEEEEDEELDNISQEELEKVRDRLKKKIKKEEKTKSEDEDGGKEEAPEKKKRREELREEARKLQKELADSKKKESQQPSDPPAVSLAEEKAKKKESESEALAEFRKDRQKYKDLRRQQPAKGQDRESMTLALLAKFQDKLEGMRKATVDYSDDEEEETEKKEEEEEEDNDATDLSWMNHTLKFDDQKRKVLDANINDVERYEIFDPRNPITKRRRENSKKVMKEKR